MTSPLPGFVVTTPFGTPGSWSAGYHTGEDYSTHGATGERVQAARAGRVVSTGNAWGSSYGSHVVVESDGIRHGYCHLKAITVEAGQQVDAGDKLGGSGNTGNSTGPHLHYEERRAPYGYADHREPKFSTDDDGDTMPSDAHLKDLMRQAVQAELGDENTGQLSDRIADKVWAEQLTYAGGDVDVTQKAGPGWLVYTERRVEDLQRAVAEIAGTLDRIAADLGVAADPNLEATDSGPG